MFHLGKIENGHIKFNNSALAVRDFSQYEGKDVIVTVEKKKKKRTIQMNRYYWGVIVKLIWQELRSKGHELSDEDVHNMLRLKFLKKTIVDKDTGEVFESIQSTSVLSTVEMKDYFAACVQWAAEVLDLYVPDPNEILGDIAKTSE